MNWRKNNDAEKSDGKFHEGSTGIFAEGYDPGGIYHHIHDFNFHLLMLIQLLKENLRAAMSVKNSKGKWWKTTRKNY